MTLGTNEHDTIDVDAFVADEDENERPTLPVAIIPPMDPEDDPAPETKRGY